MPKCDLVEIQRRVKSSKDDFLVALDAYSSYNGEQIVEKFLSGFKDRLFPLSSPNPA